MKNDLHFATGNDERDTPRDFFAPIAEAVGGFDVDPCASDESDLARVNYTHDEDGLTQDWFGSVYVNPPYSEIATWTRRCSQEAHRNDDVDLLVGLFPARTSTKWFHRDVATADLNCFVKGRLTFGGADHSAPFPSVVSVWNPTEGLCERLERVGWCVD